MIHSREPAHLRTLLRCGASPELTDQDNHTPLDLVKMIEPRRHDLIEAFEHQGVRVWNYSRRAARAFEEQDFDGALRLFNAVAECGTEAIGKRRSFMFKTVIWCGVAGELSPTAIGLLHKHRAEVALKVRADILSNVEYLDHSQ